MKLLAFADLHGDFEVLKNLKIKASNVDMVICAGDISQMETNLIELMNELNSFNKPVMIIHGNHEDERGLRDMCERYSNITFLHKGLHIIANNIFMGYGGDGFSTTDPDFTLVSNSFFKPETQDKEKLILITHGPAYDTGIDKVQGQNRGNKSYREFINDVRPHLAISGHLHENAGKHHKIGRTLFINPGKEGVFVNL